MQLPLTAHTVVCTVVLYRPPRLTYSTLRSELYRPARLTYSTLRAASTVNTSSGESSLLLQDAIGDACCGCEASQAQLLAAVGADTTANDQFGDARSAALAAGHQSVVAWLDAVKGWPAFRIAVSLQLHADATTALRVGRQSVDPALCAGSLKAVIASAAATHPKSPQTIKLVRLAFGGWSPFSHWLYKAEVRDAVTATLTVALLLDTAKAPRRRRSPRLHPTTNKPLPLLPPELWVFALNFLTRQSWSGALTATRPAG